MKDPRRKQLRLQNYDYSNNGAYFVTISTQNREEFFGIVGADSISAPVTGRSNETVPTTIAARMIAYVFENTISQYKCVYCPNYVLMPNHFHAIIIIDNNFELSDSSGADIESAPTLSEIVQSFKRHSTIEYSKLVRQGILPPYDKKLWQRSFYDHIIRNDKEFQLISKYIIENPQNWENDRYYENTK